MFQEETYFLKAAEINVTKEKSLNYSHHFILSNQFQDNISDQRTLEPTDILQSDQLKNGTSQISFSLILIMDAADKTGCALHCIDCRELLQGKEGSHIQ